MKKARLAIISLIFLVLVLTTSDANAQYTTYPSNNSGYSQGYSDQGYGNSGYSNQGYDQNYSQGGYNQGYGGGQLPPLQGSVMVAPAGTSLNVATTTAISSGLNNVGDPISTRLAGDLYVSGGLILPAGSVIEGQVTQSQKAGRAGKNGMLGVRFTTAVTPNGQRVPISARIATEDGSGLIRGGSSAEE